MEKEARAFGENGKRKNLLRPRAAHAGTDAVKHIAVSVLHIERIRKV
jgi:hypothetical protein